MQQLNNLNKILKYGTEPALFSTLLCIKIKCKDTSTFFFHAMSLPFEPVSDTQSQKEQGGRDVIYFCQNKLVPILCVHVACEVNDYLFPHSVLEM